MTIAKDASPRELQVFEDHTGLRQLLVPAAGCAAVLAAGLGVGRLLEAGWTISDLLYVAGLALFAASLFIKLSWRALLVLMACTSA